MSVLFLIFNFGIIALLVAAINKYVRNEDLQFFFYPALALRLLGGIALGLIYTYYYPSGDTFNFHRESVWLTQWALADPKSYFFGLFTNEFPEYVAVGLQFLIEPRSLFFSKILSLLNIVTGQNYWLNSLYLSLVSFCGTWYLSSILVRQFPKIKWSVIIAFLALPSLVFWTSGVLKDGLAFAAIALMVASTLKVTERGLKVRDFILFLLAAYLLWTLKYYVAAVLIPLCVSTWLVLIGLKYLPAWFTGVKVVIYAVFLLVPGVVLLSNSHYNLQSEHILGVIVENYHQAMAAQAGGQVVEFDSLSANASSMLMNLPKAWLASFVQPYLFAGNSVLANISAIENLLVMLLFVVSIRFWPRLRHSKAGIMVFMCLIFIMVLASVLPFVAPAIGTLVRYKVVWWPFWIFLNGACIEFGLAMGNRNSPV